MFGALFDAGVAGIGADDVLVTVQQFVDLGDIGVWGATEQKVHLSPAPARKPLWRLVSSGKPSFCRTIASPFVIGV
jgi:hypothetical protein